MIIDLNPSPAAHVSGYLIAGPAIYGAYDTIGTAAVVVNSLRTLMLLGVGS